MADPKYVRRIARLPEVFHLLGAFPDGLAVVELARRLDIPSAELREDLLAYYTADMLELSRPEVLEFVGPDGTEDDPNDAEIVRILDPRPTEEIGVEYVDAAELALAYSAARLELDAAFNNDLAEAVEVLEETMFGEAVPLASGQLPVAEVLGRLRAAHGSGRRVRIEYSRAWLHGVATRVIEPYRFVQTRRGWEVDAGVDGAARTYLLSNIRSVEVLDEAYVVPPRIEELLAAQRRTETVRVRLPFGARWAAEMYAEQVSVVAEDEAMVTLDLELLPPLQQRVGLLLLVAGPDAEVVDAPSLAGARAALALRLLHHHDPSSRHRRSPAPQHP